MNTVRSIFIGALLLTCPAEAQEHRFEADPIVVVRENFVACDVLSQLLVGRPPGGRNKTTNILKEAILLAAETVGMPEVKRNEKGEITEVLETGSRGLVGYLIRSIRASPFLAIIFAFYFIPTDHYALWNWQPWCGCAPHHPGARPFRSCRNTRLTEKSSANGCHFRRTSDRPKSRLSPSLRRRWSESRPVEIRIG